jgi:hypothetical protein
MRNAGVSPLALLGRDDVSFGIDARWDHRFVANPSRAKALLRAAWCFRGLKPAATPGEA